MASPHNQALTDPIRELMDFAEIFTGVVKGHSESQVLLASVQSQIKIPASVFSEVISDTHNRLDVIEEIIPQLEEVDPDLRESALGALAKIRNLIEFCPYVINVGDARKAMSLSSTAPLRALSPIVRTRIAYPRITREERQIAQAEIAQLISWLEEHELHDKDFIRQALLVGLRRTNLRLSWFGWFGWIGTLASLREVVAAYMSLESMATTPGTNPDAEIVLRKTRAMISVVFDKLKVAKDVADVGAYGVAAYAILTKAAMPAMTHVAGLLR